MDKYLNREFDKANALVRALDNTGVCVFMYYPQTKVITVPEKVCEAYHCKAVYENMPYSFAEDFVHEDDQETFNEMYFIIDRGFGGKIITLIQNIGNKEMYKKASTLFNVNSEDRVLDVGYGNGYLLKMIYNKNQAYLYGIDISEDAKRMATKKNKKAAEAGELELQLGDCCKLPYNDDSLLR